MSRQHCITDLQLPTNCYFYHSCANYLLQNILQILQSAFLMGPLANTNTTTVMSNEIAFDDLDPDLMTLKCDLDLDVPKICRNTNQT